MRKLFWFIDVVVSVLVVSAFIFLLSLLVKKLAFFYGLSPREAMIFSCQGFMFGMIYMLAYDCKCCLFRLLKRKLCKFDSKL